MVVLDVTTSSPAEVLPAKALRGAGVAQQEEFDAFVAARSTALLRTAVLLTRDVGLAEDLLQTALAKTWFAWRRIEVTPEAYTRRVLVNTYASWWRRKWNGEHPTEELPEPGAGRGRGRDGPGQGGHGLDGHGRHDSHRVDDRTDLWAALGRLPKRQRAIVVLRYYEDLSERETADVMSCSVGTVKSQASRALAKLRVDPALMEAQS